MTHFPDELIEAARVMYEKYFQDPWSGQTDLRQEQWRQAFAAGLRAIPVSDAAVYSADNAWAESPDCDTREVVRIIVTSFITYLTGDGK